MKAFNRQKREKENIKVNNEREEQKTFSEAAQNSLKINYFCLFIDFLFHLSCFEI